MGLMTCGPQCNNLNDNLGMPSMNKMSELITEKTFISSIVNVTHLKILHGSGDEVVEEK